MAYCDIIWRFVSYDYFFVFKQKTAYEMRISDWSSDVCSSDLDRLLQRFEDADGAVVIEVFVIIVIDLDHRRVGAGAHALDLGQREQARKSVVSGKSVSVRVDLGGRRIINNKITISSCCTTATRYHIVT